MHADEFAEKSAAGGVGDYARPCRVTGELQQWFGQIWGLSLRRQRASGVVVEHEPRDVGPRA